MARSACLSSSPTSLAFPQKGVGLAHALGQSLGHFLQQLVADLVPQRVVEDLEVVQVDEQQRPVLAGAGTFGERALQAVEQELAVGQVGQRIVESQVTDHVLGRLALGDVAADGHPVRDLVTGRFDRHHFQLDPEPGAALAPDHQFGAGFLVVLQANGQVAQFGNGGVQVQQHAGGLANDLFPAVAGVLLEGVVDEHHARFAAVFQAGFGNGHDVIEPGHAGFQQHELFLRLVAFGDIAEVDRQALGERVGAHFQPAAQGREMVLQLDPAVGLERLAQLLLQALGHRLAEIGPDFPPQLLCGTFVQQALTFLVQVGETALAVQGHEGLGDAGQGGGQAHGQQQGFLLHLLLRRNVLDGAVNAQHLPAGTRHGRAHIADPLGAAALGGDLDFLVEWLSQADAALQSLAQPVARFRAAQHDHFFQRAQRLVDRQTEQTCEFL